METPAPTQTPKSSLDFAGITFSAACALHCLSLPLVAALSPALTVHLENEAIHLGFLIALIPLALVSFVRGQKTHRQNKPLILGALGIALLLAAIPLEHMGSHLGETVLTVLGSATLITAHVLNLQAFSSKPL